MIKERTISLSNIYIPELATDKEKANLRRIKSITLYFDAIAQINEFDEYTEIHALYPFSPFMEVPNPEVQVIQVTDSLAHVEKLVAEKKAHLSAMAKKEMQEKEAFMEKQVQIAGMAQQMVSDRSKKNIISGNGFGPQS